jgi:metal-responsive CopG/Arc/MetJ family transcriptional regulator
MDATTLHVQLPREVITRLDEQARGELRSRSNLVARLVDEGLRRREAEPKEQS